MTGLDVPEQDRLAEAVVRGLGEGARASNGTAAIVKPISRDVPVGNLGHVDLRYDKTMLTRLYSQRHVSAAHPAMFSLGSKAKGGQRLPERDKPRLAQDQEPEIRADVTACRLAQ